MSVSTGNIPFKVLSQVTIVSSPVVNSVGSGYVDPAGRTASKRIIKPSIKITQIICGNIVVTKFVSEPNIIFILD